MQKNRMASNKAIGFTDEPSKCNEVVVGSAALHLRPATPSVVRSEADLIGTLAEDDDEDEDEAPPPQSLQTVPILQLQALQLHKTAGQYQPADKSQEMMVKGTANVTGPVRNCFSPPPPAIVAVSVANNRQTMPHYPPAVTLPKPTPLWANAGPTTSSGSASSSTSSSVNMNTGTVGARQRPSSVTTDLYSVASTISVTTGSSCPAVVSSVPILRTFGASAGSKRQNSFGS
ncbi:uncharacterized protein LOC131286660 [Anopheles ziemanni]|uniref:uncharacterized protein LOC131259414 n=1 Tax=Anopheles coustani TaxID=139045 RepID=UPI002658170C|nr:uncharacterized protein LOC131259414 [Anopheles coustani]XP_058171627.1 uncharacterized protein LOC131286660 [Anopheles ziemanni]